VFGSLFFGPARKLKNNAHITTLARSRHIKQFTKKKSTKKQKIRKETQGLWEGGKKHTYALLFCLVFFLLWGMVFLFCFLFFFKGLVVHERLGKVLSLLFLLRAFFFCFFIK